MNQALKLANAEKPLKQIAVYQLPDTDIQIPVASVQGTTAGPVVLITLGFAAAEAAIIETFRQLVAELDPAALQGRLLLTPYINHSSLEKPVLESADEGSTATTVNCLLEKVGLPPADVVLDYQLADLFEWLAGSS